MTIPEPTPFPLGVSLKTLDPDQRLETAELLAGSSVQAVELWEPDFEKDQGYVDEMRRLLARLAWLEEELEVSRLRTEIAMWKPSLLRNPRPPPAEKGGSSPKRKRKKNEKKGRRRSGGGGAT